MPGRRDVFAHTSPARRTKDSEEEIRRIKNRLGDSVPGAWIHVFGADRQWNSGASGFYWPRWTYLEQSTAGWELLDQQSVPGIDLIVRAPTEGVYAWSMAFEFQIQWEGTVDPVGTLPYWFAPVLYPYDGNNLDLPGFTKNNAEWNLSPGGDYLSPLPLYTYSNSNTRAAWHGRYTAEAISVVNDVFQGNGDGRDLGMSIKPKFWTADWQEWTATYLWSDTGNPNRDLVGDQNGVSLLVYQIADLAAA